MTDTIAVPRSFLVDLASAVSTEAAEHMTCGEADDVAAVLRLLSEQDAEAFLYCHAWGDDDVDDLHHAYRSDR